MGDTKDFILENDSTEDTNSIIDDFDEQNQIVEVENDNNQRDLEKNSPELFQESQTELDKKDDNYLYGLFEGILFLSNEPLPVSFFSKNFGIESKEAKIILDSLVDEYEERSGGIVLREISRGFQFETVNKYAVDIRKALFFNKKESLSKGMFETLSIIVYKQPIIFAQIDELRGVSSRMMLAKLMKKNLVKPVGRKDLPGRPLMYGTTDDFLKQFGLKSLSDLPNLSEIEEFSYESKD